MTHTAFHACCDTDTAPALAPVAPVQSRISNTANAIIKWLKRAYRAHLQRRSLAKLSDRQLRDVGIEANAAKREAARSFWDLP